ncbi:hypothetical protein FNYG_03081 [Fusarium nygamai]|uniref:Uncharacterized protein n=1 Tax=Gibberella nygamai TaxID=42673 RepID=A0A2K0WML6_GIBNY|nr:hypothetical protein FNYG_03081 [Fusarium nygamai]
MNLNPNPSKELTPPFCLVPAVLAPLDRVDLVVEPQDEKNVHVRKRANDGSALQCVLFMKVNMDMGEVCDLSAFSRGLR